MIYRYCIIILIILPVLVFSYDAETVNQLNNYGRFFYELSRYSKASEYFNRVITLEPMNLIAVNYLSMIQNHINIEIPGFIFDTPEVVTKTGDAYQWYINGKIQFDKKNYNEAAEAFIKAYEMAPQEEAYRFWTFRAKSLSDYEKYMVEKDVLAQETDLKEIIDKIKQSNQKSVSDSWQWYQQALFNYNRGRLSRTLDMIEIALILNPDNMEAENLLEEIIKKEQEKDKEQEIILEEEVIEDISEPVIVTEIKKEETLPAPDLSHSEKVFKDETPVSLPSPKSVNKRLISSKERITLDDHLTRDNRIISGMYELPEEGLEVRKQIFEEFEKAQKLLHEKKFASTIEHIEKAYTIALNYNSEDLRALYYLYFIHLRKDEFKKASDVFFKIIHIISKRFYRDGDYYNKAKELADNLIYTMIIQGAYNAYRLRTGNEKFSMTSLINEGYIKHRNFPEFLIETSLYGNVKWKFSHLHEINRFNLVNKTVESSEFGPSPLLYDEYVIVEQ